MRRRQALDAGEKRLRRWNVAKRQIGRYRPLVELTRNVGMSQHALDLAGEDEGVRRAPVVERLLAKPVTSEHEVLVVTVPNRECEHSIELACQRGGVELLGEVGQNLCVPLGSQVMPSSLQLLSELAEVVDLAVQDRADGGALVGYRG